uniref:F5/8 type C domain-containing protein n=1 Tax=Steinernema glaseri TaxID=37863 RepID=A0A1I7Z1E6_9BILA
MASDCETLGAVSKLAKDSEFFIVAAIIETRMSRQARQTDTQRTPPEVNPKLLGYPTRVRTRTRNVLGTRPEPGPTRSDPVRKPDPTRKTRPETRPEPTSGHHASNGDREWRSNRSGLNNNGEQTQSPANYWHIDQLGVTSKQNLIRRIEVRVASRALTYLYTTPFGSFDIQCASCS